MAQHVHNRQTACPSPPHAEPMFQYITLPTLVVTLAATFIPAQVVAQTVPDLLIPSQASAAPRRNGPVRRVRKARINLAALDSATVRLQLFDDAWLTVSRTREASPGQQQAGLGRSRRGRIASRAGRRRQRVDRNGVLRQPHLRAHHRPGRSNTPSPNSTRPRFRPTTRSIRRSSRSSMRQSRPGQPADRQCCAERRSPGRRNDRLDAERRGRRGRPGGDGKPRPRIGRQRQPGVCQQRHQRPAQSRLRRASVVHGDAHVDLHRPERHSAVPATASWTRCTRCARSMAPTR